MGMTYWDYLPLGIWIDRLRTVYKEIEYGNDVPPDRVPLYACRPAARDAVSLRRFSPAGVLCSIFIIKGPAVGAYLLHGEFRWMEGTPARPVYRNAKWADEMPAPVIEWWHKCHDDLPFEKLTPFLTDPHLRFEPFADLLEMHAPWA